MAMCLMLNNNVVHAKDPKCKKDVYNEYHVDEWWDWKKTHFYTEYLDHESVKTLAENQNKGEAARTAACITMATSIGALAGAAAGGAIGALVGNAPGAAIGAIKGAAGAGSAAGGIFGAIFGCIKASALSEGDKWLEASIRNNNCGIKIHYWVNPLTGKWHYYGFDPQ